MANITFDEKNPNVATCDGRTVELLSFATCYGHEVTLENRDELYSKWVEECKQKAIEYFAQ